MSNIKEIFKLGKARNENPEKLIYGNMNCTLNALNAALALSMLYTLNALFAV
jgi:hypothetical protein